MTSVVLDASVALAWMLKSQATPAATTFLEEGDARMFEVPTIFEWEVHNVLLSLERRGSLSEPEYAQALAFYGRLDLRFNALVTDMSDLTALAREARLSLFDASYLALALDRRWPLVSRDEALLRAANAAGIECYDLKGTAA